MPDYRRYWATQTDNNEHRTAERVAAYSTELLPLLDTEPRSPKAVLELGCAEGELYQHLGFDQPDVDYQGVDISPSMLARFETAHPRARVAEGDAVSWTPSDPTQRFELIVAIAVAQYLDADRFGGFMRNCARLLTDSGKVVIGGIPDPLRRPTPKPSVVGPAKRVLRGWRNRCQGKPVDGIGYWYTPSDVAGFGQGNGLKEVKVMHSDIYKYRFHATLSR